MKTLIYANIFLKLLDVISTAIIISSTSVSVESNPIVRKLLEYCGCYVGLSIIFLFFCALLYIMYIYKWTFALKVSIFLTSFVVLNNIYGLYLLIRG